MDLKNTKQKILVVDDSSSIREYVSDLLSEDGFEIALAEDGDIGLQMIEEFRPNVVLLDIEMPRMNGMEVLKRLRSKKLSLSVVIVTTKRETNDVVAGLDAGADDYVVKPFDATELISRVRAAARRALLEKSLTSARDEAQSITIALQKAQAEKIHQGKMAGIGRFAAGLSHEINNPLGFVKSGFSALFSYCESLLDGAKILANIAESDVDDPTETERLVDNAKKWVEEEDPHEIREDSEALRNEIGQGLERIEKTVSALMTLDKASSEEQDHFNVNGLLEEAIGIIPKTALSGVELSVNKGSSANISCNKGQVKIAMLNIITNSLEAVKNGGEVSITTMDKDGEALIVFNDTGCGINMSDLDHVFEPFFTTKDVNGGMGLGLTISDSIVRAFGGSLHIKSTEGTGTIVFMRFPANL